jgi:hypothetical protein
MFQKSDVLPVYNSIQAYVPDARVALSDISVLAYHGIFKSNNAMTFEVSSTLFETVAQRTGKYVSTDKGVRGLFLRDDVLLLEGTRAGIEMVDGIPMNDLEGIRVRYKMTGESNAPFTSHHARIAYDISQWQAQRDGSLPAATAQHDVTPVAKPEPTWGVLTEAEEVFKARCERADWYYSYIDNTQLYKARKAVCDELETEAKQLGGNYVLLYTHYSKA